MKEKENKYYTPEIEEFRVGFEYEYLGSIRNLFWESIKMEQEDFSIMFDDWEHEQDGKFNELYRVKYLDQSDIESLGWVMGRIKLGYNELDVYGLKNYIITTPQKAYDNTHIIDISRMKSIGQGIERMFRGIIKNKSELIKLMKQLGIYETK